MLASSSTLTPSPWSDLTIITVSLNWFSLNQQTYYLVGRLVLQAGKRIFSLGTSMITNGQCVADQIYRRLVPRLEPCHTRNDGCAGNVRQRQASNPAHGTLR